MTEEHKVIRGDVEPKVKARKWTIEELRAAAADYMDRFTVAVNPDDFLTWLSEVE